MHENRVCRAGKRGIKARFHPSLPDVERRKRSEAKAPRSPASTRFCCEEAKAITAGSVARPLISCWPSGRPEKKSAKRLQYLDSNKSYLGDLASASLVGLGNAIQMSVHVQEFSNLRKTYLLITPTATVCLMSRTAKRPSGGYSVKASTHIGLDGIILTMAASPDWKV